MANQPAPRADALDRDAPGPGGWYELAVANPTFLLERLGTNECTDLPGLRELVVDLGLLTRAEGRDVANALMRAAWSAGWGKTQMLPLDALIATGAAARWEASG
jgi:hypothetical protein